ncbi:hypothetical protein AAGF08_20085 [Algoriphagus sp. SE2]|uniref:hypothetical protein n=1 Tax=Algoriphagus sp. SE2 TaxID=3141536 RepID=UPI0031CD0BF9
MEYNQIRDLIIKNKIEEGLQILLDNVENDIQNDIILLTSQFHNWEKNHRLNLGAPIEERNRIIYAILSIITQIEKESKNGLEAKRLNSLQEVESDLALGYEKLVSLKSNGAIDLFMIWLTNRYPKIFQKLLDEEKNNGKASSLFTELSNLNLDQFASEYNLNATTQSIHDYILEKGNSIPMFFTGWIEYSDYKERFAVDLNKEIDKYKQRHQNLLKTGIIGAIIGASTFSVFERSIDKVIDLYESGSADEANLNHTDDDDDDDDGDDD